MAELEVLSDQLCPLVILERVSSEMRKKEVFRPYSEKVTPFSRWKRILQIFSTQEKVIGIKKY